ncbi:hypothetical protein YC2023_117790 [Brassica napus]
MSSTFDVRLLNFWKARNAALTLATVNVYRLLTFRHLSKAGLMYSVTRFDIIRANQNFKLFNSHVLIQYNDSTVFDEITEPVSPLKNVSGSVITMSYYA